MLEPFLTGAKDFRAHKGRKPISKGAPRSEYPSNQATYRLRSDLFDVYVVRIMPPIADHCGGVTVSRSSMFIKLQYNAVV